ncbi:NADH-quinone oxidoreductase subunit NuoG [Paralimibaculum aggregatum]|uniref:NADH-quinone oxidoreductase n=1 Tax=Paralimibaculum aggregatum TaxID=3036245 RepID=A0ABQ6LT33_9RHOB|nr:NADH-quinone oxidoreductase subunit NuoG [Limibaculum sp. NKW23]GMG85227.1 NADH-quinone oxidoreductase subunit NuoG [Limibaculum sp. NKW23]
MSDLRTIIIDGREIEADPNLTVIQACEQAGIEIPRFCYHERLSIAGNCRMCLVEPVGAPKPAASCHLMVRDLRGGRNGEPPEVRTNSPMVKKAREGVMEFLLINHPLDCPICDQGGECDLQDQAMAYGVDFSRYREPKRAVEDLHLGPLVETHMTRCISCTRCVRFITEVAGVSELGQIGRGEDAEITNYLGEILKSEMQGNIVDLCPVGALTNKPYSFSARPWELTKTQTIDAMDALGANIRVDTRGRAVMRVLPRNHDGVNEEWIADRTRHVADGLARQRLDKPYIRENGKLRPASWAEALELAAERIGAAGDKVAGLAGDLVSVEAVHALKSLLAGLGSARHECRQDGAQLPAGNRSAYVGTARIEDLDGATHFMLIGTNPRIEAPVLNARIRKAWLAGAKVGLVGPAVDLTYDYHHYGDDRAALASLESAKVEDVLDKPTVVIVGQGALTGADGAAVLARAMAFAERSNSKFLVLHTAAARVGAMDLGFVHEGGIAGALDGAEVVLNLGADETEIAAGPFVIYQGHHGDRGAHRADVILPGAAYTEQSGLYVNTEGRVQMAMRAGFPPGEAKEDWAILRALSGRLGSALPFDSLDQLRSQLFEAHPHLAELDTIAEAEWQPLPAGELGAGALASTVADHYLVNPVLRASPLMAELSRLAAERAARPLAAE